MTMLKPTVQYLAMVHIYTCTTFHGLAAAFSLIPYFFPTNLLQMYFLCMLCYTTIFNKDLSSSHNKGSQIKRNQIPPHPPPFKNKIKCVLVNILNCSVKWFNTPFEVMKFWQGEIQGMSRQHTIYQA